MESSVKQRLIKYLDFKGISKTEFGKRIGVSSAFITSMRKSIQPDKAKSIALEYPDLNIGWLLTGEGEMLKKVYPETKIMNYVEPPQSIPLQTLMDRLDRKDAQIEKLIETITSQAETIASQQRVMERTKMGNAQADADAECADVARSTSAAM